MAALPSDHADFFSSEQGSFTSSRKSSASLTSSAHHSLVRASVRHIFGNLVRASVSGHRIRDEFPVWIFVPLRSQRFFHFFPPMCMETIKKNKKVLTPSDDKQPSIGPVKVFRIDDVSVSVFARDRQVQGED